MDYIIYLIYPIAKRGSKPKFASSSLTMGLFHGGELILSYAAQRALKILRQVFKLDTGFFLVIDPAADITDIFHGNFSFG